MSTDYSWFEKTLGITKRYRVCGTWHYSVSDGYRLLEEEPRRKLFKVTRESLTEDWIEIEGSHRMNPPASTGASEIETAFNVKLPQDIHDFYKLWGGGFLMLSEFHYILSPAEVITYCRWFRGLREEPLLT